MATKRFYRHKCGRVIEDGIKCPYCEVGTKRWSRGLEVTRRCVSCGDSMTELAWITSVACKICRNPQRHPSVVERRRARTSAHSSNIRAQTHEVTPEQVLGRIRMFGAKCWICGKDYDGVDHVIPLSKGGLNMASNIRPACKSCNSKKGSKKLGSENLKSVLQTPL